MLRGRLSIQRQSGKALRAEGVVGASWRGERGETSFEPAAHIRLGVGSSSQVLSSRLEQRLCRDVIRRAGRRQNVRPVRGLVWCFEMRASCVRGTGVRVCGPASEPMQLARSCGRDGRSRVGEWDENGAAGMRDSAAGAGGRKAVKVGQHEALAEVLLCRA